jgi:hypothetical protein
MSQKAAVLPVSVFVVLLIASPALAGPLKKWTRQEIDDVLIQTQGLRARTTQIRDDARDMAEDFRDRTADIRGDVEDELDAALGLFKETIKEERADLNMFLADEQKECKMFVNNLLDISGQLNMMLDELLTLGFDVTPWEDVLEGELKFFDLDLDIGFPGESGQPSEALCKMIYPFHVALGVVDFVRANEFMQCVLEDTRESVALLRMDETAVPDEGQPSVCEIIMENDRAITLLTKGLNQGSLALKTFFSKVDEKTEKEKQINVAVWGWVGTRLKITPGNRFAKRGLQLGVLLKDTKDALDEKVDGCKMAEMMANQEQILLLLAGSNP